MFTPEALYEYEDACRPPPPYNCSALCFGTHCAPQRSFCSVYDVTGALRNIDVNCTGSGNVTYQPQWGNTSLHALLDDPRSALALELGINASEHICYNHCENATLMRDDDLFFHNADVRPSQNCSTACYLRTCMDECAANCTAELEYSLLPSCPRHLACHTVPNVPS